MEAIKEIPGAPKPVGAYSPAIKSGNLVFCSGQIALDPETNKLVEGGVEQEARQVLKNLSSVLKAAGTSSDKILMTTIFLAKIEDAKAVNAIYSDFVNAEMPPARQTIAVKDLPLGVQVEISVIAEA